MDKQKLNAATHAEALKKSLLKHVQKALHNRYGPAMLYSADIPCERDAPIWEGLQPNTGLPAASLQHRSVSSGK